MNDNHDDVEMTSVVQQVIGRQLIGEMSAEEYQLAEAKLADAIRTRKSNKLNRTRFAARSVPRSKKSD